MPPSRTGSPAQAPFSSTKLVVAATLAVIMAGIVAFAILSNTGRITSAEQYAATIAQALPFGYAFAAGMVASVNPCGFLMLPAFVGYQLGSDASDDGPLTLARLGRGLTVGMVVTLGFLVLFSAIGAVLAAGGHALVSTFKWAGLGIGILMTLVGAWLLITGKGMGLLWASRVSSPSGRGLGAVFLYGVAYGLVSLSCTLPVFLVVVGTSLASSGFLPSLGQFISYALGMGVVIVAVTLATTTLKGALADRLRGAVPFVHRTSALFLLGAGAYLVVYWVWLGDALG